MRWQHSLHEHFNILFILGLSALVKPLPVQLVSIKIDIPTMIFAAVALIAVAWDGVLSRFEGVRLVAGASCTHSYWYKLRPVNEQ